MRLVGYCRVSSPTQVETGQGLAIQQKTIREWINKTGKLAAIPLQGGLFEFSLSEIAAHMAVVQARKDRRKARSEKSD